mgnify:CR=1 FL=1
MAIFFYSPKLQWKIRLAQFLEQLLVLEKVLGGVAADWWDGRFAGMGAPFGLRGWQFAFLLAAVPGLPLAGLLWRLAEMSGDAPDIRLTESRCHLLTAIGTGKAVDLLPNLFLHRNRK